MAIRHIDTWSTSLYTTKSHKFSAKVEGESIKADTEIDEAISRSVLRQAKELADRYIRLDSSDLDLDPRAGYVLVANSATVPTPMLYNETNSAAERFEYDFATKTPRELRISTESGDSKSLVQWDAGQVRHIEQFRSLNTSLLRDEKLEVTIDPQTGVLNYSETTRKRWF